MVLAARCGHYSSVSDPGDTSQRLALRVGRVVIARRALLSQARLICHSDVFGCVGEAVLAMVALSENYFMRVWPFQQEGELYRQHAVRMDVLSSVW